MKQSKRKRKLAPSEPVSNAAVSAQPMPALTLVAPNASAPPPAAVEPVVHELGVSCTMREGAALKADLLKLLHTAQPVMLDVTAIERIDTSALQLLCAFVRDRRAQRLTTRWRGAQPVFSEAIEILGLTQALSYAPAALA